MISVRLSPDGRAVATLDTGARHLVIADDTPYGAALAAARRVYGSRVSVILSGVAAGRAMFAVSLP